MISQGWYKMSNADYHGGPGISRSGLVRILRSPAHYKTPEEPTPIMLFGSAFHSYVLEPKVFDAEYIVRPEGLDGRTKAGKEWIAQAEASGKIVVKQDDFDKIRFMKDAIFAHPLASALLQDGEPELSGFWTDPDDPEILCKLRLDWINKPSRVIIDLKKTTDARAFRFEKIAYDKGYHMEAGWYCYGAARITRLEHDDFRFIVVEDSAPWGVMVYRASQDMILEGLKDCAKALTAYKKCVKTDTWPCYPLEEQELRLPGWVTRKNNLTPIFD